MLAAQIIAVLIFVVMFLLIITEKIERQWVTLGCALAVLVLVFGVCMHSMTAVIDTLNVKSIFSLKFWYEAGAIEEESAGINWATILFIAGMMIMVEGMAKSGFFHWLCITIAKLVHFQVIPIFITFMIMSALLAMFIDSITVILFLAAVTVELAKLLGFNPVPMILTEIFCANLGGSSTMCGDPPNIIIGTALRYSFFDFVTNTGVMALLSLVVVVIFFYFCFHKELKKKVEGYVQRDVNIDPWDGVPSKKDFVVSCIIFACAVVLLVTHANTGLTVAFIGVFIALLTILTASGKRMHIIKCVDYKTLLFFIGLFVVVGGLEQTEILNLIAQLIEKWSKGNLYLMVAIILWISAVASAFVDNIPFAATMVPIIKTLAASSGADLSMLAWTLSMGTDIGGSATPIGASANVVGISVATKEGHPIGWGTYCKSAIPATIIVLVISMVTIWLRYV